MIAPVWLDGQALGSLFFSVIFTVKYALMGALTALWLLLTVMPIAGLSIAFLRRSSYRGLTGLSVLASIAALVFAPLVRITPEQYCLYLFLAGFFPIPGAITAAVVTNAMLLL